MTDVDVRQLHEHTDDLVRRAQSGERIVVSASEGPAVQLSPVDDAPARTGSEGLAAARRWRRWDAVAPIFHDAPLPDLADEIRSWRSRAADAPDDPFGA